ncbi:MAG TPA: site-2 protease family protein [Candidatus Angelobacter sp.]|nr:site-2 protease family protein [Candidatus Angelobacter sp.]
MSSWIPDSGPICARCSHALPPEALICDRCHALVHSGEVERLAAQARALEAKSLLKEARERWLAILPLLPYDSKQAEWIRDHARQLESAAPMAQQPQAPGTKNPWAKRLAPLAPIAVLLAKFKSVIVLLPKLQFFFSFASFIGLYWALWGPKFGIGFALLVLIHEMGHYIDIKRRGLPANMPVFFPGLGAYVRWQAMGVPLETRAAISLAGPLAGTLAAAVCALVWRQTGDPLWAALARVSAWLNLLNLIPIWIFDGAQAAKALRKTEILLVSLVATALGYATHETLLYLVAAGGVLQITMRVVTLMLERRKPKEMVTLGLEQRMPVPGTVVSAPEDLGATRRESHGIAAYYLAVLTALGLLLWLVPGHGNGVR